MFEPNIIYFQAMGETLQGRVMASKALYIMDHQQVHAIDLRVFLES